MRKGIPLYDIVATIGEMGSFGEVALSYTNRRTATIVCSKPTIFLTLNKASFGSILESAKNMTADLLELIKARYPGIF